MWNHAKLFFPLLFLSPLSPPCPRSPPPSPHLLLFFLFAPPPGSGSPSSSLLHLIMLASNFNVFFSYNTLSLSCLKWSRLWFFLTIQKMLGLIKEAKILKKWNGLLYFLFCWYFQVDLWIHGSLECYLLTEACVLSAQ